MIEFVKDPFPPIRPAYNNASTAVKSPSSDSMSRPRRSRKNTARANASQRTPQFGTFIAGLHKIKTRHLVLFVVGAVVTSPVWVPIYAFSAAKEHIQGSRQLKKALAQTNNESVRHGILKEAITSNKDISIGSIKRALNHLNLIEDRTLKASLLFLALNSVGYKAPKERTKIYKQVEQHVKALPEGEVRQKLTTITDHRLRKNKGIDAFENAQACEAALKENFGALVETNS